MPYVPYAPHGRWAAWDVRRKVKAYEPQVPWPM
jgi:hypothetical protein